KPVLLTRFPSQFLGEAAFIHPRGPAVMGIAVLVALAAIARLAWRHRRPDLASLATIAFVCCVGTVIGFSSVQRSYLLGVAYLVFCLWVIGAVLWIVWIWSAVEVVGALYRRFASEPRAFTGNRRLASLRLASAGEVPVGVRMVAMFSLVSLVALTALGVSRSVASPWTAVDLHAVAEIQNVSTAVERAVQPPGPVAFDVRVEGGSSSTAAPAGAGSGSGPALTLSRIEVARAVAPGVVYQLATDGWHTGLRRDISPFFDTPQPGWPVVMVTLRHDQVVSTTVLHPPPQRCGMHVAGRSPPVRRCDTS
ncbi:MAG: hypothetical protein ACYCV7_02580, partial [Acidimicrobiales bacterium]